MINNKETYILIPSYEPDENLVPLVNTLLEENFDIILVNDGSGEKFDYIFDQVKDKVHYINQQPNKGKGAALRKGFSFANINYQDHKFVITCDGDGQHAVSDIIKINEKLHQTNSCVFGVRVFDENTPKRSRNGNFMSRLCRSQITKEFLKDDQCGLRGFPISLMNELLTIRGDHYEYEMNVICTFQFKRYPIHEHIIQTIYLDDNSSSHFSPKLDTYRIQTVIWQYDLIPLIAWIFGNIGFMLAKIFLDPILDFPLHIWIIFGSAQWLSFFTLFGLLSLFFPTKQIGRRGCIESIFFAVKGTIAAGIFALLYYLTPMYATVDYLIATFLVCFINYFLSLIIHKAKFKKIRRRQ